MKLRLSAIAGRLFRQNQEPPAKTSIFYKLKWQQLMRIKLTMFFVIFAWMQVTAKIHAQKVSLNKQNTPIEKVFLQIENRPAMSLFTTAKC
jgi:hypothetical protein